MPLGICHDLSFTEDTESCGNELIFIIGTSFWISAGLHQHMMGCVAHGTHPDVGSVSVYQAQVGGETEGLARNRFLSTSLLSNLMNGITVSGCLCFTLMSRKSFTQ